MVGEGAAACGWPCSLLPPALGKVGRDMEAWVGLEWKQSFAKQEVLRGPCQPASLYRVSLAMVAVLAVLVI